MSDLLNLLERFLKTFCANDLLEICLPPENRIILDRFNAYFGESPRLIFRIKNKNRFRATNLLEAKICILDFNTGKTLIDSINIGNYPNLEPLEGTHIKQVSISKDFSPYTDISIVIYWKNNKKDQTYKSQIYYRKGAID